MGIAGISTSPGGDALSAWGSALSGAPATKQEKVGGDSKDQVGGLTDMTGAIGSGAGAAGAAEGAGGAAVGGAGGIAGLAAEFAPLIAMFSDKNKKTDIEGSPDVLSKMGGVMKDGNSNLDMILQMSEEIDKLHEMLKKKQGGKNA